MDHKAVIFDLDGVIVSTDEYHFQAWKYLADKEGIYFDRQINHRLRGVSRMESLEILLEKSEKPYIPVEKLILAERKNSFYREFLHQLSPGDILPGILEVLSYLKGTEIKIAIASSSKNAGLILHKIGLSDYFDAIVDGNDISKSKPDAEVFLLAAQLLGITPDLCLVIEDAEAGIEAAKAAGMRFIKVRSGASEGQSDVDTKNLLEACR